MKEAKAPAAVYSALERIARNIAEAEASGQSGEHAAARPEDPGRTYQSCPYYEQRQIALSVCAEHCRAPKREQKRRELKHDCLKVRANFLKAIRLTVLEIAEAVHNKKM